MAQANTEAHLAITLDGEQQMVDFGVNLASAIDKIKSPLLILLNGDLGAGKTTISRGILQGLGHHGPVKRNWFGYGPISWAMDLSRGNSPPK